MSTISFNPKKSEYLNEQAKVLLAAIIQIPHPHRSTEINNPPILEGYLTEKDVILDIGEIIGPMDELKTDLSGRVVEKFRSFENEKVGYDFKGVEKIHTLIYNILKDSEIEEKISEYFLFDKIFEWLITTHGKEDVAITLSKYLEMQMNSSIKELVIYIPVLFLEADRELLLGDVRLLYLKESYIRELSKKVADNRREEYIKSMIMYKGQLMAKTIVYAESGKAIANAQEKACFAIDILRILSPTVEEPRLSIYYDVDFRNTNRKGNQVIVQEPNAPENMSHSMNGHAIPFVIDQKVWFTLLKIGLPEFVEFKKRTQQKVTELDILILNAIKLFSKALGNHDFHERIVYIYSVLESLLLLDENSAIIDSVAKYLPLLITSDINQRKQVASTVKGMYNVRSAMIHHGKKKDIDMKQLKFLQVITRALIISLVKLTPQKTTKREILKEIDDRLMSI